MKNKFTITMVCIISAFFIGKKRVMRRSIRNARSAYWLRKWQYRVIKSSLTTLLKGALRGSFFLEMVSGITY